MPSRSPRAGSGKGRRMLFSVLGDCRRDPARAMRRVQLRGGARWPHARRTLCTLSVRSRAPTKQMGLYHRSRASCRAAEPSLGRLDEAPGSFELRDMADTVEHLEPPVRPSPSELARGCDRHEPIARALDDE